MSPHEEPENENPENETEEKEQEPLTVLVLSYYF